MTYDFNKIINDKGYIMKKVIKLELSKAFKNKFFYIAIIIGITITLLSFQTNISEYLGRASLNFKDKNPMIEGYTAFSCWIGGEPFSLGTSLYFFLFPLLVALPYGWSYCEEKKGGYRRMLILEVGKKEYYLSKYIAVFLSGGATMIIPLSINFWMTLMVVPAICPDPMYSIYNAVFGSAFLSEWYYTIPFLYVIAYLVIDFIYGGILACISMAAAGWIQCKWVTVIIPFLVVLFIHICSTYVYSYVNNFRKELSLFYFLRGTGARKDNCGIVILFMGLFLLGITLICVIREAKQDIY